MIDDVSGMVMLLSKISLRYVYVRLVFPAGKEVLHNNIILVKIRKNYLGQRASRLPASVSDAGSIVKPQLTKIPESAARPGSHCWGLLQHVSCFALYETLPPEQGEAGRKTAGSLRYS